MIIDPEIAHGVHYLFEWAAILTGLLVYRALRLKHGGGGLMEAGSYAVLVGALIGGAVGNKVVFWLDTPEIWSHTTAGWDVILGGQSIVGGLLGGWLGVEVGKRISGITSRTQVYECLLALIALGSWPLWRTVFTHTPGLAFRCLMLGYLLWRVAIDWLKPVSHEYILGLSGIQLTCIVATFVIIANLTLDKRRVVNDS